MSNHHADRHLGLPGDRRGAPRASGRARNGIGHVGRPVGNGHAHGEVGHRTLGSTGGFPRTRKERRRQERREVVTAWLHSHRLDRPWAYLWLAAVWLPVIIYLIWGR